MTVNRYHIVTRHTSPMTKTHHSTLINLYRDLLMYKRETNKDMVRFCALFVRRKTWQGGEGGGGGREQAGRSA